MELINQEFQAQEDRIEKMLIDLQCIVYDLMRKVHRTQMVSQRTETRMLKSFELMGVDVNSICKNNFEEVNEFIKSKY